MPYYLHRLTPLHDWSVYVDPPASHRAAMPRPEGEIVELPECHWFSQAQAEADRRIGGMGRGRGNRGCWRYETLRRY